MASAIPGLQLANGSSSIVGNTLAEGVGRKEPAQRSCASCARNVLGKTPTFEGTGLRPHLRLQHRHSSTYRQRRARLLTARAESANTDGMQGEDNVSNPDDGADWREFRARLLRRDLDTWGKEGRVASEKPSTWAHPIVTPETGCVLIAHPRAFGMSQTYFRQSVIFLFSHSEKGCAGVILNKPLEHTLGALGGFEELMPEFESSRLYMGGDVGKNSVHVLHGVQSLPGGTPVVPGVCVGGYDAVKDHVSRGLSSASDYRWFARYSGWGAGQLEGEVKAGVWFLASTSADLILKQTTNADKPLWREVLELMGGKYADIARHAYGEI